MGGYTTGKPNKMTQSTGMATQMQRKKIAWPPRLLERKNKQQQSRVFLTLFLMLRLTWTTEKELGRRISLEEKHENFIAVVRK